MSTAMLQATGLTKDYGDRPALLPTDLRVERGEQVALIGHNGSGKSTLLKLTAGMLDATGGTVSIAGQPAGSDFVNGIAPMAQVIPIRTTTSVILLLPNKLIPALNAAVQEGADVVNISLGLPNNWSALHAAVRNTVENGLIIVAASGNYWPFVVYPAALPEVLAAASRPGWRLVGDLPLRDRCGGPLAAAVRPPVIAWSAAWPV